MIKLSANYSKKLPVPGLEFSSRSCSAGLEIEVAGGTDAEQIKKKLRQLYALLEEAVDKQFEQETGRPTVANGRDRANSEPRKRNGSGNGRTATDAQLKAIRAIAKDHGLSREQLEDLIEREFGIKEMHSLSLSQASRVIDLLKEDGKDG